MTEKLKPCPFCGANPVHGLMKAERCQLHGETFQRVQVNCPRGHAQTIGSSLEAAKELWNTRSLPRELEDLVEAMKGIDHFKDALNWRNDHLSKALAQWIEAGSSALAKNALPTPA